MHIFDSKRKDYQQIFWIQRGLSRLSSPVGVAVDDDQNVYISDSQLNQVFVYNRKERFWLTRFFSNRPALFELARVIGQPDQFERLGGMTFNTKNKLLYVVDSAAHRIVDPVHDKDMSFGIDRDTFRF